MVAFVNTFTAAARAAGNGAYINDILAAENFISSHWTNSITLNLTFDAQARGTNGTFLATNSWPSFVTVSYTTLRNALIAHGSPAALPVNDPTGGHNFSLPEAYARMLGLSQSAPVTDDTVILNTSYNWSYGQDVIGTIEHEITEGAMGRIGGLGDQNSVWSTMDLFRYSSAGVHDVTDGRDGRSTFFSVDGNTMLLKFHNEYNGATKIDGGDPADFDVFDIFGFGQAGNNSLTFSNTDFLVMSVLGWTPTPQGNPAPPAATTAALIMRHGSDGQYYIYDIGNNALLAAYKLGQVGTDWTVAGLGGFFGNDTNDMLLRNSNTGAFYVYDVKNNNITGSASLGAVGLNWQVMGFGNFSSFGETDMMMRRSSDGAMVVYDIRNNQIIGTNVMGTVGLDWQVGGFGNFSSRGTSDMIMRNTKTGGLEVYDINSNQITGAAFMGTVGLDWQVMGFGNFSSRAGVTDMIMRNTKTGGIEIYDINNNQITSAYFLGTVGLNWQFAGIGPIHAAGASDLVLCNANTGAFQVYDLAFNSLIGSASLGSVGLDWQVGGIAVDPPTASSGSMGGSSEVGQLVQALAGFGGGSGPADSLNSAPLGTETSHQALLTTPQHG